MWGYNASWYLNFSIIYVFSPRYTIMTLKYFGDSTLVIVWLFIFKYFEFKQYVLSSQPIQ